MRMNPIQVEIQIPFDIDFEDLLIKSNDVTLAIDFDWAVIDRICLANGIQADILREAPQSVVLGLIESWYRVHLLSGGPPNYALELLMAESPSRQSEHAFRSHPHPTRLH